MSPIHLECLGYYLCRCKFFWTCFLLFWIYKGRNYLFRLQQSNQQFMFKSIGTILVLYAITQMMSQSFNAFENAVVATFETVETAAQVSKTQIEKTQ